MKLYIYIIDSYFQKLLINTWVQTIERRSAYKYVGIGVLFFCLFWSPRQSFAMNGTNGEQPIRHPLETNTYEEPIYGADSMDSSQGELTEPSSLGETISLQSDSSPHSSTSESRTPPPPYTQFPSSYTDPPPYEGPPPPYSPPGFFYLRPQHPDTNSQARVQPLSEPPPYRPVRRTVRHDSYSACRNSSCLTLVLSGISGAIGASVSHAICNNIGCTLTFGSVGCIGCCFLNIMGFRQVVDRYLCDRICVRDVREAEFHGENIELSILTGNFGSTPRERNMRGTRPRNRPICIQPQVQSLMRNSGRGVLSNVEEEQHTSGGVPSEDASTDESHHSENQAVEQRQSCPVIVTQPRPSCMIEERETVLFLPGYNHQEQCRSLDSLQSMLVPISMQVMHILKSLALNVYEIPKDTETHSTTQFVSHRKRQLPSLGITTVSSITGRPRSRITAFVDGYPSTLKQKSHSGQVGMVIECTPMTRIALAYTCYKDTTKKDFYGIHMGSSVGYTQMKVHQEGISSLIAVNPTGSGFTSHLSCCYGWGNAKTIRHISSIAQDTKTKGHPDIYLRGGLMQLGYNYPIVPSLRITPYVEYLMTYVQWRPYRESSGMFPRELSKNKERIEEKGIGVRNQWMVTSTSHIQTWIAGVIGYRKQSSLHSKLLQAHNSHYEVWVPIRNKRYRRMDIGIAYTIRPMDTVRLALNGKTGFEKSETFKIQQIGCTLQYFY